MGGPTGIHVVVYIRLASVDRRVQTHNLSSDSGSGRRLGRLMSSANSGTSRGFGLGYVCRQDRCEPPAMPRGPANGHLVAKAGVANTCPTRALVTRPSTVQGGQPGGFNSTRSTQQPHGFKSGWSWAGGESVRVCHTPRGHRAPVTGPRVWSGCMRHTYIPPWAGFCRCFSLWGHLAGRHKEAAHCLNSFALAGLPAWASPPWVLSGGHPITRLLLRIGTTQWYNTATMFSGCVPGLLVS